MSVTLSHVSLVASDMDRTGRILTEVLDAREVVRDDGKRDIERFYLVGPRGEDERARGTWIAVVHGPPADKRLFDHLAFHVPKAEFASRLAKVRELDLDAIKLPEDEAPGGLSLRFHDHDGHLFELHTGALGERLKAYDAGETGVDAEPESV